MSTAEELFAFLPEWQLIICRQCQHAVWPMEIRAHLSQKHRSCTQKIAEEITAQICSTWTSALLLPSNLYLPTVLLKPIPELGLYSNGVQCQLQPTECQFTCRSLDVLRKHWRLQHDWLAQPLSSQGLTFKKADTARRRATAYRPVHCQRFFPSRQGSQYIAIEPEGESIANVLLSSQKSYILWLQLWAEAEEKYEQRRNVNIIQDGALDEVNPWLRRTGWIPFLRGCSMADLLTSIQKPDDEDSLARYLWDTVGEVAAQSQQTVAESGVMLRFEAVRTELEQVRYHPLEPYRNRSTINERCRPWQQIVLFLFRTQQAHEWQSPQYQFNHRQARAYSDMITAVEYALAADEDADTLSQTDSDSNLDSDLDIDAPARPNCTGTLSSASSIAQATVLRFCIELLNQKVNRRESDMALVGALAVLGISPSGNSFRGPESFPSILSSIIKVAHFMVVQYAETLSISPRRSESNPGSSACTFDDSGYESEGGPPVRSSFAWVRRMMNQFMVRGTSSPMQWILDLRAYGMKIDMNTTSEGHIQWRDGDVLAYKQLSFSMADFRGMVHQLVQTTQKALVEQVLFTTEASKLPVIPWDQLFDDPSNGSNGWNFLQDQRTPWPVEGSQWLYHRVQASEKLRERFAQSGRGQPLRPDRIHDWFRQLDAFRGKLLALLHLTGGQPARGTELLSVRHSNTMQGGHRNLFIENGTVVFVCRYHKGYEFKGDVKIIHRYLPREVGQLVVWYCWLALPFAQRLESLLDSPPAVSSYLWPTDTAGRTYTTDRLKHELQQATVAGLGQPIHVAAYRHIAIAISRRFVRSDHAFQEDDADFAAEDGEDVADAQAAHSPFTAGAVYARELDELPGSSASRRQLFRRASIDWHRFLGFVENEGSSSTAVKRSAEPWEAQAAIAERARKRRLRESDLGAALTVMMKQPTEFRSVQRAALQAIQDGRDRILVVMPTGGGKSVLFLLPALVQTGGVTIVVVPLRALRQDLVQRATRLGIRCAVWEPYRSVDGAAIVLTTPERAEDPAFGSFVSRLRQNRQLDRIVIDECHVILSKDWAFRRSLARLGHLATAETQMLLLTATLPPTDESTLLQRMDWTRDSVEIIRAPTARPNIAYSVVAQAATTEGMIRQVSQYVLPLLQDTSRKAVIMCRTRAQIEDITAAGLFPCEQYHAKLSEPWKAELLDQLRDGQVRVLVATSAFSMGVDIPDIGLVLHVDAPDSLLDYSQASGRAGRDGIPSQAVLLYRVGRPHLQPQMQEYAESTTCRRLILQEYFDGVWFPTACTPPQTLCDQCQPPLPPPTRPASPPCLSASPPLALEQLAEQIQAQRRRIPVHHQRERHRTQADRDAATISQLERWKGQCLICTAHDRSAEHIVTKCSSAEGALAGAVQDYMRTVRYPKHVACFRCGIPQRICNRWSPDGRTEVRGGVCQYYGILAGIVYSFPTAYPTIWARWLGQAYSSGWIAQGTQPDRSFWGSAISDEPEAGTRLLQAFLWLTEQIEDSGRWGVFGNGQLRYS